MVEVGCNDDEVMDAGGGGIDMDVYGRNTGSG